MYSTQWTLRNYSMRMLRTRAAAHCTERKGACPSGGTILVPRHYDVDRFTRRTVRGDKKLDANVKAAVGVQLLIPPDRAHWADVHYRAGWASPSRGSRSGCPWRGGIERGDALLRQWSRAAFRPSLLAQSQETHSGLRDGLMLQVICADLAVDVRVRQAIDRNQLRRHGHHQIGHIGDPFAVGNECQPQFHMTHFPYGTECVAQPLAGRASRGVVEKGGEKRQRSE